MELNSSQELWRCLPKSSLLFVQRSLWWSREDWVSIDRKGFLVSPGSRAEPGKCKPYQNQLPREPSLCTKADQRTPAEASWLRARARARALLRCTAWCSESGLNLCRKKDCCCWRLQPTEIHCTVCILRGWAIFYPFEESSRLLQILKDIQMHLRSIFFHTFWFQNAWVFYGLRVENIKKKITVFPSGAKFRIRQGTIASGHL